jgi:beta-galactosidase GanA
MGMSHFDQTKLHGTQMITLKVWAKQRLTSLFITVIAITSSSVQIHAQQNRQPYLRKQGTATQLIVDDKPFLVLGGELGNSSSSSLEYMAPIWPRLAALKLNTVLVPVYWELLEPAEGKYDFTLVDGLIRDARKHNLKLVPLWFGSWKNSMSSYAPAWVKRDQRRFPRSQDSKGNGMEILSPFSKENVETDAHAFSAFMRHVREVDTDHDTVIMVQVENEIGMIPESRDRSQIANELFNQRVPVELMNYLQQHKDQLIPEFRTVWATNNFKMTGTWEEIFGTGPETDEIFMAWYFARYTNRVAETGKAEYALPMFVNAALIRPGHRPGQYPSAGPLPHLMDVWRAGAPKIDFLSPDIYFQNFAEWVRRYDRSGNPVFIPEAMPGPVDSVNVLYAIGQHNAIGFSPFSIDSLDGETTAAVTESYELLTQLTALVLANQGKGTMAGLLPEGPEQRQPQQLRLGNQVLYIGFDKPTNENEKILSGGLVIALGPDEYLFAGTGLTITFETAGTGDPLVGLLAVDEGKYVEDQWVAGRRLNGDQTHQGRHVRLGAGKFGIQRVKVYRYR